MATGATETVTFDKGEVGKPPGGWTATQTGTGQTKWPVVQDNTTAEQTERAPTVGAGDLPRVPQRRQQSGGRARRGHIQDVTIYHTINGRRTETKRAHMTVTGSQWHILRVLVRQPPNR
jgi:hypothetical protein